MSSASFILYAQTILNERPKQDLEHFAVFLKPVYV